MTDVSQEPREAETLNLCYSAFDDWQASHTDGRVSPDTITLVRSFLRYLTRPLTTAIAAAEQRGRLAGLDEAAGIATHIAEHLVVSQSRAVAMVVTAILAAKDPTHE